MAYKIKTTHRFDKDYKRCIKRGYNISLLQAVMLILRDTAKLPSKYHPHKLSGIRANQWECRITPDWLMVWEQDNEQLTMLFLQTGTHADLF